MQRTLVSHVFEAPRPSDWKQVLSLKEDVDRVMSEQNLDWDDVRFSRLVSVTKQATATSQCSVRDIWDWNSLKVAVLIEGWAKKE